MTSDNTIKEIIKAIIFIFIFLFLGIKADGIFIFLVFFSIIPAANIFVLKGFRHYLILEIFSFFVIFTVISSIKAGIVIFVMCFFTGYILGYCRKKDMDLKETLGLTTLSFLITLISAIFTFNIIEGINQIDVYIFNPLNKWMELLILEFNNLEIEGGQLPFDIVDLKEQVKLFKYSVSILLPGISISIFGIISLMNIYISSNLLIKKGITINGIKKFNTLKASRKFVWIYILCWLFMMILNEEVLSGAMANMSFILHNALAVFGFSLVDFYLGKKVKKLVFRIIIYIFLVLVFMPITMFISMINPTSVLVFLAILDSFLDMRNLAIKGEKNG
jgi:uncharacterized protein YybS (DUF2232 family)